MVMSNFFKKMEDHYTDAVQSVKRLIEEGKIPTPADLEGNRNLTSILEVRFLLHLISKLRNNLKVGEEFNKHTLVEMLKGGHTRFEDDGSFYDEMLKLYLPDLNKRTSSHNSVDQQYSISGPLLKEVLFGVSIDEKTGKRTTWMQLERHHTRSIIEFIMHIYDYLLYKWSGKNIGPFGWSVHTEHQNTLVVKVETANNDDSYVPKVPSAQEDEKQEDLPESEISTQQQSGIG